MKQVMTLFPIVRIAATRQTRLALATLAFVAMSGPCVGVTMAADLKGVLTKTEPILEKVLATRTVAALCSEREPQSTGQIDAGLAIWEQAQELRVFDALMAGLADRSDAVARELEMAKVEARRQIAPQLDDNPGECEAFAAPSDEPGELRDAVRALALYAHNAGLRPRPAAIPDTVKVRSVSELSRYATQLMTLVAPAGTSAKVNRDAGEAFLEYYLDALGYVAVYGRIEDSGDIREWRGDYQSRYRLECGSFASRAQEELFSASAGREMIIVGEPGFAHIRDEYGTVRLNKCVAFEHEGKIETSQVDPSDPAMMLRPLNMTEAFAGPMKGPQPDEIDRILYDASFDNRMDGFGNGYVDRREAIYVLLRAGTAFRHDWSFPVTDIDLDALKRREPEKVFAWHEEGDVAVLEAADGTETRLEDATRLVPIGDGATLHDEYYYLQIAMAGRRSDRAYEFRSDGQVTYTSGGFVAGNFGSSYIIVSGAKTGAQEGSYRFDDYALIVETTNGQERRFFAIGADQDPDRPEEVIIDGTVYWRRTASPQSDGP